jgi:hypothetical protein
MLGFRGSQSESLWPRSVICSLLEKHLLVLSDFTMVAAYDRMGLLWKSTQLSSDGVELIGPLNGGLKVCVFDSAMQKKNYITINLDDGSERKLQ